MVEILSKAVIKSVACSRNLPRRQPPARTFAGAGQGAGDE